MTKRAIVGKVLAASAIAIAIGADATTHGVERNLEPTTTTTNDNNNNNNNKGLTDPELLEYFGISISSSSMEAPSRSGESSFRSGTGGIPESWLPYPSIHVKESIWNLLDNNNNNNNGTVSSSAYSHRRRAFGNEDEDWEKESEDDSGKEYANYIQEEMHEHYEELITEDDDDGGSIFRIDDDLFGFIPSPSTSSPTLTVPPTGAPTSIGSSFWDGLDAYEEWHDDDDDDATSSDNDDYAHNTICLKVSLGVVNYHNMSDEDAMDVVHMALRTMTKILNDKEHTDIPFMVHDKIDEYHHRQRRHQRELQTGSFGTQVEVEGRPGEIGRQHLADLILENVIVDSGDHNWWVVSAIYTVWKRPHGGDSFLARDDYHDGDHDYRDSDHDYRESDYRKDYPGRDNHDDNDRKLRAKQPEEDHQQRRRKLGIPVKNQSILTKIEGICRCALERSIQDGTYWNALHTIEYGNHDLVLDQNIFYADEKGMIDAQPVGDEYDMSRLFCPIDKPRYDERKVCPEDVNTALVEDQWPPYFSEGMFGVPAENSDSNIVRDGTSDATYPRVIAESLSEIEWGDREWVGLALLISTIVWTILLTVSAHLVFQKRRTQILWGTPLTSSGVDDILKVGWRVYEQPQQQQQQQFQQGLSAENLQEQIQPPQQQSPPQLFLQIYDKGQGIGYNDENSLLKGGAEQQS